MLKNEVKLRNSIFGRFLFTFMLIVIPLYFGGISIYSWGVNTVRQEITDSVIAQVNNYLRSLERDIQRIKELQYQACVNDDDFSRLSVVADSLSNVDRTFSINRFRQRLIAIKSSSEYIENVNAYIPTIDRVINATGDISEISVEEYEILKNSRAITASQLIYRKGKLYLVAAFPQQDMSNSRYPRIIEIEISINNFKNALIQIDSDSNRGTLLISPPLGFEISNGFGEETIDKIREILEQNLQNKAQDTFSVSINNNPYLTIYTKSDYLGMVLCKYIPEDQVFAKLNRYQIVFWIFTAIAFIIVVMFTLSTNRIIHQPLIKLVKSFENVENGSLEIKIHHKYNDEFRYLYKKFNVMVENLNVLIHQVYKQKILAQNAELKHLQSQINPHFLYNNFFSLHNMVVKGDYENVEQFTQQLGTYFQFITRSAEDMVTIEKEIAHARIYSDIQARRFRNRIRVEFGELPKGLENIIVPRLIVQPIIENAFGHGLRDKISNGILRITFISEPGSLLITVEDNGDGIDKNEINRLKGLLDSDQEDVEITGIINIHRRLQIKYGVGSGLKFSIGELKGLKVEMLIITDEKGEKPNDDV